MVKEVSLELEYNCGGLSEVEDVTKKTLQVGKVIKAIKRDVAKTFLSVKISPIKTIEIKKENSNERVTKVPASIKKTINHAGRPVQQYDP